MIRSLYSGVSGMRSNQAKMDVVGNNIANSSTTGFKAGRVRFEDMLSQTISSAQGPVTGGTGGINGQQIGLGVKIGSIDSIMTGGTLQPTNRDLDLAIEGEGFFTVQDSSGNAVYTRDGAFYRDSQGSLVNSSGYKLLGYTVASPTDLVPLTIEDTSPAGKTGLESYSINASGEIVGVYSTGGVETLGQIALAKFANPGGLEKMGGSTYRSTLNSGVPTQGLANADGFGVIRSGVLEMSNVDLANEFTDMIITSRSYQANSRMITTSDEMLQELINLKR